jgi:hypothetical protein
LADSPIETWVSHVARPKTIGAQKCPPQCFNLARFSATCRLEDKVSKLQIEQTRASDQKSHEIRELYMMRMRELEAATKAKQTAVCFVSFHGVSAEFGKEPILDSFWPVF